MNTLTVWFGAAATLFTIVGMFVGAVAAIAKLWIRPLELQVQHVNALLAKDVTDLREVVTTLADRVGRHTGNDAKHVPDGWRQGLDERLRRIEESQVEILSAMARGAK